MRGKFAPVIETTVGDFTDHDRVADSVGGTSPSPPRRTCVRSWLTAHSPTRALPSNSRAFRFLIFGSSVSMLGTRISTIAFPMLVLGIKDSPLIAGAVTFAAVAPGVLLYMPAGVIVDHQDPRRIIFLSEIARGTVAALVIIGLFMFREHISIIFLMLAMFTEEVLEIFSTLADRRYLSLLIKEDDSDGGDEKDKKDESDKIRSRHASAEARQHAAALAGRPIGPLLFTLSPFLPFLADAASFVTSVISLVLAKPTKNLQETKWPSFKQLTSGIGYAFSEVRGDRHIWLNSSLMALTSMVSQALILIFLFEAHSSKLSALEIGFVLGASGIGGAVGSYSSKFIFDSKFTFSFKFIFGSKFAIKSDQIRKFWLPVQMGVWFFIFLILVITRGASDIWSAFSMFIMSVTGSIGNIEGKTYLDENFEGDKIGRISGFSYTMTIGSCALGPVLGGYAVQVTSIHRAVFFLFIIVTFLALASLLVFINPPSRTTVDSTLSSSGMASDDSPEQNEPNEEPDTQATLLAEAGIPSGRQLVDHYQPLPASCLPAGMQALKVPERDHVFRCCFTGQSLEESGGSRKDLESMILAGLDSFGEAPLGRVHAAWPRQRRATFRR
jgi:Major Facilitator Superfamily/Transmembrane secretion effector